MRDETVAPKGISRASLAGRHSAECPHGVELGGRFDSSIRAENDSGWGRGKFLTG